ncbi:MAG: DUF1501 domain-containing protein [Acidobacteria bacterium]|nr:DUF1501 domain-containing protein [Acidobacteriota bacterium]
MSIFKLNISRRALLRKSIATASLGYFGVLDALAQAGDYKALVCVFLFGGNDSNNMIVPMGVKYNDYSKVRGAATGLAQNVILPIMDRGEAYGFHPQLPRIQQLYNQGKAAAMLNVGPLIRPITKTQYRANQAVPSNLYSHSDQQQAWQQASTSGVRSGWGGRAADAMQPSNTGSLLPMSVSTSGGALFTIGQVTGPAIINGGNGLGLSGSDGSPTANARDAAFQQVINFQSGLTLVQAANRTINNGIQVGKVLNSVLTGASGITTVFPNNGLGNQLAQVARIIRSRQTLGVSRQIFFVSTGGFDNHDGLLAAQQGLFTGLNSALSAFYDSTIELGMENSVTTFTESDFNRTFGPNGNNGTDHAWGSHQLMMGGAVNGGRMYGTFPNLAIEGPDDVGNRGLWLPTTSVEQYGATMSSWFGVNSAQLDSVFPNLINFPTRNLGFMK